MAKRPTFSAATHYEVNGQQVPIHLDVKDVYEDDHPLVKTYPDWFVEDEPVEAATAAPGEKRTTAKRARKATKKAKKK